MALHGNYSVERVTFESNGVPLVGNLYIPHRLSAPAPAMPLLGPFCFVKEQSPFQYATRLADEGYVTLIFDPRHHGESGGEPRRYENPVYKVADVAAAITFLQSRPEVDATQIAALGICQGSSEMLQVAAEDQRVKLLITVTGQYLDYENKVSFLGSESILAERIERGRIARAHYDATGEVEYLPIVDPERKDVGLPHRPIWGWYHGWASYSRWENRYAVMSDADIWTYDALQYAAQVQVPTLMIHGGHSDGPAAAWRHFEALPVRDKQMIWEEDSNHLQYYWEPPTIDRTVSNITHWLRERGA